MIGLRSIALRFLTTRSSQPAAGTTRENLATPELARGTAPTPPSPLVKLRFQRTRNATSADQTGEYAMIELFTTVLAVLVGNASNDTRDWNNPTSANQIKLQTSLIRRKHHPIRAHLPAKLGFR
jgi:hypothetical protein